MTDKTHINTPADEYVLSVTTPVTPVFQITGDGRIFWRGREVTGDEEFRLAILDLRDFLNPHRGTG